MSSSRALVLQPFPSPTINQRIHPSDRSAQSITHVWLAGVCAMLVDMRASESLVESSEDALTRHRFSLISVCGAWLSVTGQDGTGRFCTYTARLYIPGPV